MKQLWKKFDKLTEICYMSELEDNCPQWDEAYEVFKQLVAQGREKDPQYAAEILKMDDATDFAYGVADWIEDYLDELDAREEHEKLMERCEELLNLFQWQEVYPGDLKFRIASALAAEDKKEEALKFCEKWYAEDQHEMAATALVYAKMTLKDLEGAEDVVRKYISEDTPYTLDEWFGGMLLERKHPVLREYLERELRIRNEILDRLKNAPNAEKRAGEIEEEKQAVIAALEEYEGI